MTRVWCTGYSPLRNSVGGKLVLIHSSVLQHLGNFLVQLVNTFYIALVKLEVHLEGLI